MNDENRMTNCLFCAIGNKIQDAVVLWEDTEVMAFLDTRPIREGHCQIITKQHIETFEDMPSDLAAKVLDLGQRLARKMKAVYGVERVAFLFTGGDIPHVHAHVIPMHEKTDITSARYIVNPEDLDFRSAHLQADRITLERVRQELRFD